MVNQAMLKLTDAQTWLDTPIGSYLLAQEQSLFDEIVSNIFGFNAIYNPDLHHRADNILKVFKH